MIIPGVESPRVTGVTLTWDRFLVILLTIFLSDLSFFNLAKKLSGYHEHDGIIKITVFYGIIRIKVYFLYHKKILM